MKNRGFALILALLLLLLLSLNLSNKVSAAEELPVFYNITLKKSYNNPMSDQHIEQAILELEAGNLFAKKVGTKLVNYNEYRKKVAEVIVAGQKNNLSNKEIGNMIMKAMPDILESLPAVKVDTLGPNPEELKVIRIY